VAKAREAKKTPVTAKATDAPIVEAARRLRATLAPMRFAEPVAYVYDPLDYAWEAHALYLTRYASGRREVVLLGMNPGPFGMAQTGVPFGDPVMVREFLGLSARVGKPPREHPQRVIEGFASARREVSGTRLWGWAKATFGSAEAFAENFTVLNHCPLVFMEESGRNRTPDKLPKAEREPLLEACDAALAEMLELLSPRLVVGLGRYAEARAALAVRRAGLAAKVVCAPHPSPANPSANRDWAGQMTRALSDAGAPLSKGKP